MDRLVLTAIALVLPVAGCGLVPGLDGAPGPYDLAPGETGGSISVTVERDPNAGVGFGQGVVSFAELTAPNGQVLRWELEVSAPPEGLRPAAYRLRVVSHAFGPVVCGEGRMRGECHPGRSDPFAICTADVRIRAGAVEGIVYRVSGMRCSLVRS